MANTINDLYLKYVNKVGRSLENDRYFRYLFEMAQAGSTELQQRNQVLHKVVDERWLSPGGAGQKDHRRQCAPLEPEHPVHRAQ